MGKNKLFLWFLGVTTVLMLSGCATSHDASSGHEYRRVGNVKWHKEESFGVQALIDEPVSANSASVFFYRVSDNDNLQSSVNVAINGRFQTSLQPNHFSQVYSCTGINDLSAEITGHKNNVLDAGVLASTLQAGKHYYFKVDVDSSGMASIQPMSKSLAIVDMQGMQHQTHQISRVIRNCPVAEGPARTELKVFFDTDRHFVKKEYYSEIKRVADFMSKYPNTTAIIEGHTDSRASANYNKSLSQRRVDAVRVVLVNHFGISASRLRAVGYGEKRPIATNATAEGRQQNRRVIAEFLY